MTLKKNLFLKIINVIALIVIIAVTGLWLVNAYFSVLKADDFQHAVSIGVYHVGVAEHFKVSLQFAKNIYCTWQGTYFAMFLQAFLSPVNTLGLPMLRGVMIVTVLLLVFSIYFYLKQVFTCTRNGQEAGLWLEGVLTATILWQLTESRVYDETLEWFSGATAYTIPLALGLIALGILMKQNHRQKKSAVQVVLACVLGFLSAGGSLCIVGPICAILLLTLLWNWWGRKKISRIYGIGFCIMLAGALFNAFAPGNFVRQELSGSEMHLRETIGYLCERYSSELQWLLQEKGYRLLFWCMCILGMAMSYFTRSNRSNESEKKETIWNLVKGLSFLIVPCGSIFPVVLGYDCDWFYPNRCLFVLDFLLCAIILWLAFYCGRCLGNISNIKMVNFCMIWCGIFLGRMIGYSAANIEENVAVKQIYQIRNGIVQEYYADCKHVLEEIEQSEESDVVIYDYPPTIEYFTTFKLSAEADDEINEAIALVYGKDSVRIEMN